jgi:hypothetical protein
MSRMLSVTCHTCIQQQRTREKHQLCMPHHLCWPNTTGASRLCCCQAHCLENPFSLSSLCRSHSSSHCATHTHVTVFPSPSRHKPSCCFNKCVAVCFDKGGGSGEGGKQGCVGARRVGAQPSRRHLTPDPEASTRSRAVYLHTMHEPRATHVLQPTAGPGHT